MDFLKCISPVQLFFIAVAISVVFIVEFEGKELDVIGNFFIGVGSLLVIVASQSDFLESLGESKKKEEFLNRQIALLEEKRDSFKKSCK